MRVGVVGCGYWGSKHVRVLSSLPLVSKVTIIDDRPEVRYAVGRDFPHADQRPSLTEAIDELDAVVVATPPAAHHEVAAEAIAGGTHVLVEKPMATSVADARHLVTMATEAGVTLAVGHTFVHNPAVVKLAELVAGGELGRVHYLDAARLNLGLYRDDVNVLWDLASHDISIATLVLRDHPDLVCAWGTRHTTRFAEDVATLRMVFDRQGVEATVRSSWLDPLKVRRTTVVGTDKMAVYNDVDADERIKIYDRGRDQHDPITAADPFAEPPVVTYRYGDIVAPRIEFQEPLRRQANDFLECALTGRTPVADGLAGLTVVAVLEAADTSMAHDGAPVAIDLPELQAESSLAA